MRLHDLAGLKAIGWAITGHVAVDGLAGHRPCHTVSAFSSLVFRAKIVTSRPTLSTASSAYDGGKKRVGASRTFAANI
jgi:hypothetical protein